MARLAGELKAGLESVRDGVSEAMATMARRIDELKGGQDDLSDRVLFGQADAAGARPGAAPFASLAGVPAEPFALFLKNERPQVCALVLSFLDDALAARLLSRLPEAVQPEVTRRVATMDWVTPQVLSETERILGKKLSAMEKSGFEAGGVKKIVGILNFSPRETERRVITALDLSDPELAESIKRTMFVFEDIIILDDESIAAVLEQADEQDIVVAMKPLAAQERERLLSRFPADRRERIGKSLAALGRVRLAECDAAGFRVVELIRALEKEGRIGILRQGE
jgi:flagellar motor switch protein FliG